MGYRLNISDETKTVELGKFYGYVDLYGVSSVDYLYELGKIDDADIFNWMPSGPEFDLDAEQFRTFMDLYCKDIQNYDFGSSSITYPGRDIYKYYPELKEMYNNDKVKHLAWM